MSLDSPYGLIGFWGVSSSIGTRSGVPNVAQVEENTRRRTRFSTMAFNKLSPPHTLLWKYLYGFCIDSATSAFAAKCMTASGSDVLIASEMDFESLRSP